jgi:hypothetical protein
LIQGVARFALRFETGQFCVGQYLFYRVEMRRLSDLSGIGPAMLRDFDLLEVKSVEQLSECDPQALYDDLCHRTNARQDPCVLDTFTCAVAQARNPDLPAEQRNSWYWSRVRKAAKH